MSAIKLREGVWSVGVLNPSLRVFDIVMESKFGTSYNAYLLTGEKNVLIETVHADYFEEYVDNIRQVLPLEEIDYLIMDHNEPDHSGSVAKLLSLCPKLEVIATQTGKKYLQDITNLDLPCRGVAAGDTLDLGGGRVLEFIPAPMLHWADSMFTWDKKTGTLFSGDFLGAHFCEPTMLDTKIRDRRAYEGELIHYYACIFGPFKPHVLAGLDKMPADVTMVCPSHGPCLTDTIGQVKDCYRTWSTPAPKDRRAAFIVYASAYGYTEMLAQAAAKALEEDGYAVTTADVTVTPLAECVHQAHEADVLLVGSPTINRAAPKPVWDVLTSIDPIGLKGRSAGAFGAYGWSGEAAPMLHTFLQGLRYAAPEAPFRAQFRPTEADLDAMAAYARSVAALCKTEIGAPSQAEPVKAPVQAEPVAAPAKVEAPAPAPVQAKPAPAPVKEAAPAAPTKGGKRWVCALCGYIYDPAEGDPSQGVAPGTAFEDLPDNWSCPWCGTDKGMFNKGEEEAAAPVEAPVAAGGQKWVCALCGYIYDPAEGDPSQGVAPGTAFEDLPDNWSCPWCGTDKGMFNKGEEEAAAPVEAPVAAGGQKWVCALCGYIYDPAEGDPAHGVAPGTAFEDVPGTWSCPLCGVDKGMFDKVK